MNAETAGLYGRRRRDSAIRWPLRRATRFLRASAHIFALDGTDRVLVLVLILLATAEQATKNGTFLFLLLALVVGGVRLVVPRRSLRNLAGWGLLKVAELTGAAILSFPFDFFRVRSSDYDESSSRNLFERSSSTMALGRNG